MLPARPSHAPTRVPAFLPQRPPGERDGNREEERHLSEPERAGQCGAVEDERGGDAGDERRPARAQRANHDRCRQAAGGEAGELPHEQGRPEVEAGERESNWNRTKQATAATYCCQGDGSIGVAVRPVALFAVVAGGPLPRRGERQQSERSAEPRTQHRGIEPRLITPVAWARWCRHATSARRGPSHLDCPLW